MANNTGSDLESNNSLVSPDHQDIDQVISDLWRQMVIDIKSKAPNQGKAMAPSYLKTNNDERMSPDKTIFCNSNLPDVFNSVWYKKGSKEDWRMSFDCLLPKKHEVRNSNVQNYRQC